VAQGRAEGQNTRQIGKAGVAADAARAYQSLTQKPESTNSPVGGVAPVTGAGSKDTASLGTVDNSFSELPEISNVVLFGGSAGAATPSGNGAPSFGSAQTWITRPAGTATGRRNLTLTRVPWRVELTSSVGWLPASVSSPT